METELRSTSPNRRYEVRVSPWEARMSLWVETPLIIDTSVQQSLLHFTNPSWSLISNEWQRESTVVLYLSKFPGGHLPGALQVIVDCITHTAIVHGQHVDSLSKVEQVLEHALLSVGEAG
jgi:hypothetical protein